MNRKWLFAVSVSIAIFLSQFCAQPSFAQQYLNGNLSNLSSGKIIQQKSLERLKLTAAQKTKLQKIRKDTINNVMTLLTPAQRGAWKITLKDASTTSTQRTKNQPPKPLPLTEKQRAAIRAIGQKYGKQINIIDTDVKLKLTPMQITKRRDQLVTAQRKAESAVRTPAQNAQLEKIKQWYSYHRFDLETGASTTQTLKIKSIYINAQKAFYKILTRNQQMLFEYISKPEGMRTRKNPVNKTPRIKK